MPSDTPSQLLEREAELGALEAAISVGTGGAGRVVVLEGVTGVGKSALLDVARDIATDRGVQVLSARGSELMRDVPFGVAVELFSERLRGPPSAQREALFAGAAGLAASLFWPGTESEPAAAPDPTLPMVHGLYWLLVNLTERAPCLVVVDDAHCVDEASLAFLVYLVERVEGLPVTVLIALRPEDAAMGGRPMARLRAVPTDRILHLEPLSKDATARLIRSRYFPDADAEFCSAVFDASRGNPFIAQELARTADQDGVPPVAASADRVRALAPESTVRAVRSRISRLSPEAWQLAQAVAVLGDDAHFRHAAALAGLGGEAAVTAADALMGAGVLTTGDPLGFSHPIIATSIYTSISPVRRATIHARAANLLTGEDPHPERLAHHLMQSPALGDPTTVERLLTAARRAVSIGAPTTAVRYLERALAEPPPASMRALVLAELGRAAAVVGDPAALQHLGRALELLDSESERALVVLDIGRTMIARGHHQEASAALRQGLEDLGTEPAAPLRLGLLTALLQASRVYPAGRSPDLVTEAEAALPAGDEPGRRWLLAELSFERLLAGRPCEEVRDAARQALSGTTLLHEVGPNGLAYYDAVAALIWADDLDAAGRSLDVAQVEAERCGWVMSIATASHRRALLRWQQGAVADAAAEAQRAVSAADQGWAVPLPAARAILALALLEQGDRSEAAGLLDLPDPAGQWRDTLSEAFVLHARACLGIVSGDHRAAADYALAAGRIMTDSLGAPTAAVLPWRSTAATALLAVGDRDAARILVAEELDLARAFGAPRPIGVALRIMGVVEGGAAGIEHLEEAVGVLSGTAWRLESARALVDLGRALRQADRKEAVAHLDDALELAERCGSVALAERARQELAAAGSRPRRQARGSTVLTAAEQRVARLAAGRLTNREIAQKLFVSSRAVEFHLGNIYAKLGISSRRELGAALGDELDPPSRLNPSPGARSGRSGSGRAPRR